MRAARRDGFREHDPLLRRRPSIPPWCWPATTTGWPANPRSRDPALLPGEHAGYLVWLSERTSGDGDPLAEASARDYATRDYKRHSKDLRRTPRTVNKVLAGLDSFYRNLGMGPPDVRREDLPAQAPRALSPDEQRDLLRAGQRRGVVRDRAIVALALFAGLRLAEMAGLDVDDVAVSARRGRVRVRHRKGDTWREVQLGPELRQALETWLAKQPESSAAGDAALFISYHGGG